LRCGKKGVGTTGDSGDILPFSKGGGVGWQCFLGQSSWGGVVQQRYHDCFFLWLKKGGLCPTEPGLVQPGTGESPGPVFTVFFGGVGWGNPGCGYVCGVLFGSGAGLIKTCFLQTTILFLLGYLWSRLVAGQFILVKSPQSPCQRHTPQGCGDMIGFGLLLLSPGDPRSLNPALFSFSCFFSVWLFRTTNKNNPYFMLEPNVCWAPTFSPPDTPFFFVG